MSISKKRFNFSVVLIKGQYYIQCDDTKELMSDKINTKNKATRLLRQHVYTEPFLKTIEELKKLSKKDLKERVKLFKGRLRPICKPWTIEEARLVASIHPTRGHLFKKNNYLYTYCCVKGWLDDVCQNMPPGRNKFVYRVLNPNISLANLFDSESHRQFTDNNPSAYSALRRYGVDTVELFENRDDATYIKSVFKKLTEEAVLRMIE